MMLRLLALWARRVRLSRRADFVIGGNNRVTENGEETPYLLRWYAIPRNPVFNIYIHQFLRSDDDCALHDHPWFNLSILLEGSYREHTISYGGINHWKLRAPGLRSGVKFRTPWSAHRVVLLKLYEIYNTNNPEQPSWLHSESPCHTLFITGPKLRRWGFHCRKGWRDFSLVVKQTADGNQKGAGCGELE